MSDAAHGEVAELLGAYALHAVDPEERTLVEEHLETCPRCRGELREHEAVAALLGNSGGAAPEGVWDRIAGALEEAAPPMRLDLAEGRGAVVPLPARPPSRRRLPLLAVAAAAALVIAGLGAQVLRQDDQIDDLRVAMADEGLLRAANLALRTPGASEALLASPDGSLHATAVVLPDGTGYLMLDEVPDIAAGRTYQLWGRTDGGLISLGVLGDRPDDVAAFHASGGVQALAVTEEDAPGVVQSRNAPVLIGDLA